MAGLFYRWQLQKVSAWQHLPSHCRLSIPHLDALGPDVSHVSFWPVGIFASMQHLELCTLEHFSFRLPAGPCNRILQLEVLRIPCKSPSSRARQEDTSCGLVSASLVVSSM